MRQSFWVEPILRSFRDSNMEAGAIAFADEVPLEDLEPDTSYFKVKGY